MHIFVSNQLIALFYHLTNLFTKTLSLPFLILWYVLNINSLFLVDSLWFLRENNKKYITFTVPTEKEVAKIEKNGEKITKNISYILQFIDSARLMASSLSNFVNNHSEGIHKTKGKCHMMTKM